MHSIRADQFVGCVLGLATGDALGAPHEGGPLERFVWRCIGKTCDGNMRWTDDTQMARDLAESLLAEGCARPDAIARRFADGYRWSRGYGPGTTRVLRRVRAGADWQEATTFVHAEGSLGNGAAMRAPIIALFFANEHDAIIEAATVSAKVTHAHPLGIEGAVVIAIATRALIDRAPVERVLDNVMSATSSSDFSDRFAVARTYLEARGDVPPAEVAKTLGNGITAVTSCVTASYIALRHLDAPFETMMRFIIACGGDVDTIGAMAGAMWGAYNGAARLPAIALEERDALVALAGRLHERAIGEPAASKG